LTVKPIFPICLFNIVVFIILCKYLVKFSRVGLLTKLIYLIFWNGWSM
jgi:hypothetical protein